MSPIESALLDAICRAAHWHSLLFRHPLTEQWVGAGQHIDLFLDAAIETYRVDILLRGYTTLAIECDGHDFHDRTKQQAAYDRARDRELLRSGIVTIRFTGSEIFHSAERCADEALRVFAQLDRSAFDARTRAAVLERYLDREFVYDDELIRAATERDPARGTQGAWRMP